MRVLLIVLMILGFTIPAYGISMEALFNRVFNSSANTLKTEAPSVTNSASGTIKVELKDITNVVTSATNTRQTVAIDAFSSIVSSDSDRKYLKIHNISPDSGVYINLVAPASAVDKTGIYLNEISRDSSSWWEMPTNAIYTGEISAKAISDPIELMIVSY